MSEIKDYGQSKTLKKLKIIEDELDIIQPESLLKNVDPSIEATELIEQIQKYNLLIHQEISTVKNQEREIKERNDKITKLKKKLDKIKSEEKINPKKSTPALDLRIISRGLENEIFHISQKYNENKSKNEQLMKELNELRKNVAINKTKLHRKLGEMSEKLKNEEQKFFEKKQYIEKYMDKSNARNENEKQIEKINELRDELKGLNKNLIDKIKETDKDLTEKLALKKYLEHEMIKISEKEHKVDEYWRKDFEAFKEKNAEQIKFCETYDKSSKVLEILDEAKLQKFQDILERIYKETNVEDIETLVEYFANSLRENQNFEDFITKLSKKVKALEQDVDELEYIINFCEQNLEVKSDKEIDEEENMKIAKLKHFAEVFIYFQNYVIVEKYKAFCDKLIKKLVTEPSNEYEDNIEIIKKELGKLQDSVRKIFESSTKKNAKKQMNAQGKPLTDNVVMDKEIADKLNVLKTKSKELFDKSGNVFSEKNMRSLISPLVLIEKPGEKPVEKVEKNLEKLMEN